MERLAAGNPGKVRKACVLVGVHDGERAAITHRLDDKLTHAIPIPAMAGHKLQCPIITELKDRCTIGMGQVNRLLRDQGQDITEPNLLGNALRDLLQGGQFTQLLV